MARFRVGQLVMLMAHDDYLPPIGAIGEIVGPLDADGDYEVMFPKHPCPVESPEWYVRECFLAPVRGIPEAREERATDTAKR
jgi:hypothetical protein